MQNISPFGRGAARLSPVLCIVALAALSAPSAADDLFIASSNTVFARGNATNGNFQVIGACGGQAHSSAVDGSNLFFGDAQGRIYRFDGTSQVTTLFADTTSDATALVVRGNELLIGGSDSTIRRLNKDTAADVGTWQVAHAVTSMTLLGNDLLAGSTFGLISRIDTTTGGTIGAFGSCTGYVRSMAVDPTHLLVGTSGAVLRMSLRTGQIDGSFAVASDCTGLALHFGSLLVSGTDGRILRVNRATGAPQGFVQWDFDIQTMSISSSSPGNPYCYGFSCPCGNDDAAAGCKNTTSVGAYLGGNGSTSCSADDLTLTTTNMPPNAMGRLFMGASLVEIPFGDGLMCAGGGGSGQFRFPAQQVSADGSFTFGPGVTGFSENHFSALGRIVPGGTWFFQGWYRNTLGPCGSGFNTTNAFSVTFTP